MPAFARKIHGKWRVAEGRPARPVLNRAGTPVDGGGHRTQAQAAAQARAINARQGGYPRRPAHAKARKRTAKAHSKGALRRSRRRPAKIPRPTCHGHLRRSRNKIGYKTQGFRKNVVFLHIRPKSTRARVRKNPDGEVVKAWVCPDGTVLPLPYRYHHFEKIPATLANIPSIGRTYSLAPAARSRLLSEVNRRGFYIAAIINGRLYVAQHSPHAPGAAQRAALRSYAAEHSLHRGIIIERQRVG